MNAIMKTDQRPTTSRYRLKIFQDYNAESPREWGNLAHLLCSHSKYNLGDKDALSKLWEIIYSYECEDFSEWAQDNLAGEEDLRTALDVIHKFGMEDRIYIQNLYLYDHGGITISTSPFNCPWDSGQIGIAFVDLESDGGLTEPQAKCIIESEVTAYDHYITGQVYGFSLEEVYEVDGVEDYAEELESCWGFYGPDPRVNGIFDELPKEVLEAYNKLELEIVEVWA